MRALSCSRQVAYRYMLLLGGIKLDGIGWRVSERKLAELQRRLERGDTTWLISLNDRARTNGRPTAGTMQEAPGDESRSLPASESTEPQNPERERKSSLIKSSAILRLEAKLDAAQARRSGKRSRHSLRPQS